MLVKNNYVMRNKTLKERFAKKYRVLSKDVQEFFYELIELIINDNDGVITVDELLAFANNPEKYAYYMFDWKLPEAELKSYAADMLANISTLIDRDGNVYNLTAK